MDYPRVLIVNSDDWQGLFIEGKLIDEGHSLGEGYGITKYLKAQSKKYKFSIDDIKEAYVTDEYEEYLYDHGSFHTNIEDVGYELDEEEYE